VIGSTDGPQAREEHTVKEHEFLIRRLPARTAALLRVHGGRLESTAEKLNRLFDGTTFGHAALHGPRAFSLDAAEWLLIGYPRDAVRRTLRLLGRTLVQVTDVSSSLVSFGIEGSASRSVLGINGDPIWTGIAQNSGEYARTRLGDVAVVLHCTGWNRFELHADRDPLDRLESWIRHRYRVRLLPPHPRRQ
jgi:sarcosine oxidase gamma subunit